MTSEFEAQAGSVKYAEQYDKCIQNGCAGKHHNCADKSFTCYLLVSECSTRTYIGATVSLARRLRQHNGELVGGARATQRSRPWRIKATCKGFDSWRDALRFEWRWKRKAVSKKRRGILRGVDSRLARATELCELPQFSNIQLEVHGNI